jgi:hypothetical protein
MSEGMRLGRVSKWFLGDMRRSSRSAAAVELVSRMLLSA